MTGSRHRTLMAQAQACKGTKGQTMTQLYGVATVAEAYRSAFKSFGPRVALRSMDGACWTYAELEQRVHRMVRYFASLGLQRQQLMH